MRDFEVKLSTNDPLKRSSKPRVTVLIPIYQDFECLPILLGRLEEQLAKDYDYDILIIDDGSFTQCKPDLGKLSEKTIFLQLAQNVGHQRSIAVGLCKLAENPDFDYVLVMDGDGEDDPADALTLLAKATELDEDAIIFARRDVRSEPILFRAGYLAYRILCRVATGKSIKFGNFSVIPRSIVGRLTCVANLWNHYAASILQAKIPYVETSTRRSGRITGRPKMNISELVLHGLGAITVFSEQVGIRLFLISISLSLPCLFSILAVLAVRLFTESTLPSWASIITFLLTILSLNLLLFATLFLSLVLLTRSRAPCLPASFWRHYVSPNTPASSTEEKSD